MVYILRTFNEYHIVDIRPTIPHRTHIKIRKINDR